MLGSHDLPYWQNFVASSASPALAALFTNPIEVIKVHQQLEGELKALKTRRSLWAVGRDIWQARGLRGLQSGLETAVARESVKNFFRIGCYNPILNKIVALTDSEQPTIPMRLAAGASSGVLSAYICNPVDLLKTRLQARGGTLRHALATVKTSPSDSMVLALWRGGHASALRSAFTTAANLPAYSLCKESLLARGFGDDVSTHIICGMAAGFATCVSSNPFDVVRSRLYTQPRDASGKGLLYDGVLDAMSKIRRQEGAAAFYKGFWSHFYRAGPHFVLTFVFLEQIRSLFSQSNSPVPV